MNDPDEARKRLAGNAMVVVPYTAEFFKTALATSYASAQRIVPLVLALVPARAVLDVGCGTGHFLRAFHQAGVSHIAGIDGDYVPRDQLVIDQSRFQPCDLTRGFDLERRYDIVVSLEVAEHLPPASAEPFVESLTRHGSVVVFSAAIPYQGGTNHLNEQWPSYWAELFGRRGYQAYDVIRPAIWRDREVAWWYRQNILLFADAQARSAHPALAVRTPGGRRDAGSGSSGQLCRQGPQLACRRRAPGAAAGVPVRRLVVRGDAVARRPGEARQAALTSSERRGFSAPGRAGLVSSSRQRRRPAARGRGT